MPDSDSGSTLFEPFDYPSGKASLRSLHVMLQIVGKVRMALFPKRENFGHVTLFLCGSGFTTRPIPYRDVVFEITVDLIELQCKIQSSDGRRKVVPLRMPVADFYRAFTGALTDLNIAVPIKPEPYDIPGEVTPYLDDTGQREFDPVTVRRVWRSYLGINNVLEAFASDYRGKIIHPQFYWHHIDLTSYRFLPSGEQQIASGFWIGDDRTHEPMLFSYRYPAPDPSIRSRPLQPEGAVWGDNQMASLRYNDVARSADPQAAFLAFYRSAYEAFTAVDR